MTRSQEFTILVWGIFLQMIMSFLISATHTNNVDVLAMHLCAQRQRIQMSVELEKGKRALVGKNGTFINGGGELKSLISEFQQSHHIIILYCQFCCKHSFSINNICCKFLPPGYHSNIIYKPQRQKKTLTKLIANMSTTETFDEGR